MGVDHLHEDDAAVLALRAVTLCRGHMPKVTSASAASITPISGPGWFGVEWTHDSVWFLEHGTKPFTMRSLAGKTIPMWVNDPDGTERAKNRNAKTRTTDDGRSQTLIFRRAAKPGQRKTVWRNVGGVMTRRDVPASYPGAPGRIAVNRSQGVLRAGDVNPQSRFPSQIARGNVGVRWRHPGLDAGKHIQHGVVDAALEAGIPVGQIQYLPASSVATGHSLDVLLIRG